nr:DUF6705 family protein [uncultured Chryseobacterium sp.]
MKKIVKICFVILICLISINCKSQQWDITPGSNNLNNNINKFIGTWNWSEGGKSFQLILKKESIKLPMTGNVRGEMLYGFHKYVDNNAVIENSTQFAGTTYLDKKSTVLGSSYDNPNIIKGNIQHIAKNKGVNMIIEYIDATHIKLLSLKNFEGTKVNFPGETPYDSSITLPQNIILTKQ